jgi:hypothetical protein
MATKTASASTGQSADILLALILEIGGLGIMTAVAGISDQMANLMVLLILGVFMLWLMNNYSKLSGLMTSITNVEKAA